ncbi:STAS domain-containing protein [Nibricoccus sp. IMCC34717]|uniref:STAS domain-containing protein n=1 Tax=Nibricoccus sp. IMCC34717 TaxID=3034021 RepID=UPI00384BFFB5
MPDTPKPTFLVDAYSDPVAVRVEGRASFANSASLHDFIAECIKQGKLRFVIDFRECASMDSTFLGVLAGAGLQLRKKQPPGSFVLTGLSQRNLELVRNLGLNRICTVDGNACVDVAGAGKALPQPVKASEVDQAKHVLAAHENLVAADETNRERFQDVLSFLRNRVEKG